MQLKSFSHRGTHPFVISSSTGLSCEELYRLVFSPKAISWNYRVSIKKTQQAGTSREEDAANGLRMEPGTGGSNGARTRCGTQGGGVFPSAAAPRCHQIDPAQASR